MMDIIAEMLHTLISLLASPFNHGMMQFALKFIPYVLFLELPLFSASYAILSAKTTRFRRKKIIIRESLALSLAILKARMSP